MIEVEWLGPRRGRWIWRVYRPAGPYRWVASFGPLVLRGSRAKGPATPDDVENGGDADAESPYCEACSSCGIDGCCSPATCIMVRCKYGDDALDQWRRMEEDGEDLLRENERLTDLLERHGIDVPDPDGEEPR